MSKVLMKGNEAIAEAAIRCGCRAFFGYPITPQSEIPEYMSVRMPEVGGVFLQAESELAGINMVGGAAGAGVRTMTSTSGPGYALMQEAMSNFSAVGVPFVVVNMMRGGPGSGGILVNQGDYFQATRGGGNGDYRVLVLAPYNVQEACDLIQEAFDLADEFRLPAILLGDAMIGQMMETVEIKDVVRENRDISWATTGWDRKSRPRNVLFSLNATNEENEARILGLEERFHKAAERARIDTYRAEDAEVILVAYGTSARVSSAAVDTLRECGIRAGLVRPIFLSPFPVERIREAVIKPDVKAVVAVEMSRGMMVDDVRLALNGEKPVYLCNRVGSFVPMPDEIADFVKQILSKEVR